MGVGQTERIKPVSGASQSKTLFIFIFRHIFKDEPDRKTGGHDENLDNTVFASSLLLQHTSNKIPLTTQQ